MPLLEAPLYAYLSDELDIAENVGERVYPLRITEGVKFPAITYQRISSARTYTYDPFLESPWVKVRIQFSVWATSMPEVITVAEELLRKLSSFSGLMGDLRVTVDIINEVDRYDETHKLYARFIDAFFSFEETL